MSERQVLGLESLEVLNLAANKITFFTDILCLRKLKKLVELDLYDPDFGRNPLCAVCNYNIAIIHYFCHLKVIDAQFLDKDLVSIAEKIWSKKKLYYSMRMETVKRQHSHVYNVAHVCMEKRRKNLQDEYMRLVKVHKDIEVTVLASETLDDALV